MTVPVSKAADHICVPLYFDAPHVCPVYVNAHGVTYYGGTWREDALPTRFKRAVYLVRIKPKAKE